MVEMTYLGGYRVHSVGGCDDGGAHDAWVIHVGDAVACREREVGGLVGW